ncbi:OCIA domain-containing protein 1-like [Anticarsia gemmatalis]|uniref:OCIA domain-containing protein 1-like n=1 Tax=Anticarsia gemmatalis TaxID=129554 RepID=UPI003F771A25
MNDPNASYGYQDNAGMPVTAGEPSPGGYPSQYKFSSEEMRVLGECNRESFVQRSLPLGTMGGITTFLAIQKGHLKPNARFGAAPKVTLAVMAGYFIGKLSYQQACAEKLMALPGSYIGQLLRERRDGKIGGGGGGVKQRQGPTMFGAKPSDIYSDAGPGSSLDLDTDRPIFSEDSYRPNESENTPLPVPDAQPRRPDLSYDDLRRRNRGEHAETKQDPYRTEPIPEVQRARPAPIPYQPPPTTNKYGDVME